MSFLHVSRTGFKQPWNEAEIQTLAKQTPPEEMGLVETALALIQSYSASISFPKTISQSWRNKLQQISVMKPRQQSHSITQIRMIFAGVRAEHEQRRRTGNGYEGQNPFEILAPPLLVDFVGILSFKERARFAQVNRVFRDAVAAYRTTQMGSFVDNGCLMELLPYFYHTIPSLLQPAAFDAFQKELEKALPEQLKDLQESSVLTDAEKAEFGKYPAYDIAFNSQLLLRFLETNHSMSLVTLVAIYVPSILTENSTLQSKTQAAQDWVLQHDWVERLSCFGSPDNKMTCIPAEVLGFSKLQELTLQKNAIRVLHPAIRALSDLHTLFLQDNRLEHLPDSFRSLTNLTMLTLSGNRFRDTPALLTELPKLIVFDGPPIKRQLKPSLPQESNAQTKGSRVCTIQ